MPLLSTNGEIVSTFALNDAAICEVLLIKSLLYEGDTKHRDIRCSRDETV